MAKVKKIRLIGGKADPEYPWARVLKKHIIDGHTWRATCASTSMYSEYDDIGYYATLPEAYRAAWEMESEYLEEESMVPWDSDDL